MDGSLPYLLPWALASGVIAGVVLLLGNLLEMMPDTIPGLVWRSALTGAVFLGAGVLAASAPVSVPFIIIGSQTLALMMCSFVFFDHAFPDEGPYAFGFAIAVLLSYTGAVFVIGAIAGAG